MSGDREVMSEQSSSVREGVDYEEVYPFEHEPMVEDLTWSLEGELLAHSFIEEEEEGDENKCK